MVSHSISGRIHSRKSLYRASRIQPIMGHYRHWLRTVIVLLLLLGMDLLVCMIGVASVRWYVWRWHRSIRYGMGAPYNSLSAWETYQWNHYYIDRGERERDKFSKRFSSWQKHPSTRIKVYCWFSNELVGYNKKNIRVKQIELTRWWVEWCGSRAVPCSHTQRGHRTVVIGHLRRYWSPMIAHTLLQA